MNTLQRVVQLLGIAETGGLSDQDDVGRQKISYTILLPTYSHLHSILTSIHNPLLPISGITIGIIPIIRSIGFPYISCPTPPPTSSIIHLSGKHLFIYIPTQSTYTYCTSKSHADACKQTPPPPAMSLPIYLQTPQPIHQRLSSCK